MQVILHVKIWNDIFDMVSCYSSLYLILNETFYS